MQISKKTFALTAILIFTLLLSVSFVCAQDTTSMDDLATVDDGIISIENDVVETGLSSQLNETTISEISNENALGDYETVEAMPQIDAGTVSGGVVFYPVSYWGSTSGSLNYTIPDGVTSIKSAKVIAVKNILFDNSSGNGCCHFAGSHEKQFSHTIIPDLF